RGALFAARPSRLRTHDDRRVPGEVPDQPRLGSTLGHGKIEAYDGLRRRGDSGLGVVARQVQRRQFARRSCDATHDGKPARFVLEAAAIVELIAVRDRDDGRRQSEPGYLGTIVFGGDADAAAARLERRAVRRLPPELEPAAQRTVDLG